MKKTVLRIAVLVMLMLFIYPSMVFAEEISYAYVAFEEEAYADEVAEVEWQLVRVPLDSPDDFFIRVWGDVTVNMVNNRNWTWIADPRHIRWMEGLGADISFFNSINDVLLSTPQLSYVMDRWNWNVETFMELDMPTIHFFTDANARIEFDFYTATLLTLSWGGIIERDTEMSDGVFTPGASITLPGSPSLTAIYIRGAYGPGNPVEYGHALFLIEVLGEDGRRAPTYSHHVADNTPSPWAVQYISRANELGILPEFMDRSLRRPINRGEFAAFAVYLYESVTGDEIEGRTYFVDTVDVNAQKLGYLGVISGDIYGNFIPGGLLTREMAAILATRIASNLGVYLPSAATNFEDSYLISDWARDAVAQVVGAGIIGTQGGVFEPRRLITREEFIIMTVTLYDLLR